jgi:hypothetical protein
MWIRNNLEASADYLEVGVLYVDTLRGADENVPTLHNAAVVEVGFAIGIQTGYLRLGRHYWTDGAG